MKSSNINSPELSEEEKRVLHLISLSKPNIHQTNLIELLNLSDLKIKHRKQYHAHNISPILKRLIELKLLQQNNRGQFNLAKEVFNHVLIDATKGEHSKDNIQSMIDIATTNPKLVDKLKVALYANNIKLFKNSISEKGMHRELDTIIALKDHMPQIIEREWVMNLAPEIRAWAIASKIFFYMHAFLEGKEKEQEIIKEIIDSSFKTWQIESSVVTDIFLDFFFLNGNLSKIVDLANIHQSDLIKYHGLIGIFEFLNGDNEKAISNFNISIKACKSISKKRNLVLSGSYGIFHILSLLKESRGSKLDEIKLLLKNYTSMARQYEAELERSKYRQQTLDIQHMTKYFSPIHDLSYEILEELVAFLENSSDKANLTLDRILESTLRNQYHVLDLLILYLVLYWKDSKSINLKEHCTSLNKKVKNSLPGISVILNQIMDKHTNSNTYEPYNFDFREIIHVKPDWERSVNSLFSYFNKNKGNISDKRLVWHLYTDHTREMIVPIEQQKKFGSNNWSKGRSISLKKLSQEYRTLDFITHHDIPVINAINEEYYSRYYIDTHKGLPALANHPLVFNGTTGEHIEIRRGLPELIIKEDKDKYHIKLSSYSDSPTVKLEKEGNNNYKVIEISEQTLDILKIVGKDGINVPTESKEIVSLLLQNIASSNIASSNLNLRTEFDTQLVESLPGDPTIIVQLIVIDEILKIKAFVRPFSGKGSYYKPSVGSVNITAQIDNMYQGVSRNLKEEQDNMTHLLNQCPVLSEQNVNDYEWKVEELGTMLEILYELNQYKTNCSKNGRSLIVEWPQGQTLFLDREVSFDNLKLNIKSSNEWFAFDGEVEINESEVLEMRNLLTKLEGASGRFIELSDKRFIALTESFAKRLGELKIASKSSSDNSHTIHKLAAPLLREFAEKSKKVKTDRDWKSYIEKISGAEKYDPQIPSSLQADLRPYQIEGFKWLARLSHLGFGACLADDMGLGKTIQTITLLLSEASKGPCLVVAPASVCYVWEEECKKFAPSLNCLSLGLVSNINNTRQEQIQNLGKMDVLICSYGILYQIEDEITSKQFQTVVLDEAQAIKNFNTKRFKIISQFNAVNKIALSGTPVENRTEELWNLFEFINPGFLGSRQSFVTKYTKPIEQEKNVSARNTLKRLIQPFILRRIKSKVLDELPPKIEQTIFIDPTDQEKSFYEALRRESLEKINSLTEASSAKKRFSILAEITKLRRACCDISLVDSELEMPSSKLDAFEDIIDELQENNHRALVFSQYVGYLDIVRKRLDGKKISYQYLDGSSTQKQRQESVEAFQSGMGDLFLISLKAGGSGLNLTSADYVIHLDPWWNPAVEDQASDRAYRIGQTRPVTIYRLVMKHSIEEKIIKMHSEKRDLAISLLSDSDKSASLNENDLLALISESMY